MTKIGQWDWNKHYAIWGVTEGNGNGIERNGRREQGNEMGLKWDQCLSIYWVNRVTKYYINGRSSLPHSQLLQWRHYSGRKGCFTPSTS